MNSKLLSLSISFFVSSLILLSFCSDSVNAEYVRTSTNWEELFDGQTSNVGQYFWMDETSNQIFEIDDGDEVDAFMGNNVIWIEYVNDADKVYGEFGIHDYYADDVNRFSLMYHSENSGVQFRIKDTTGEVVVLLYGGKDASYDHGFMEFGDGAVTDGTDYAEGDDGWYWVNVTLLGNNDVNYTCMRNTGGVWVKQTYIDGIGRVETNISNMTECEVYFDGGFTTEPYYCLIDYIAFDYQLGGGGNGYGCTDYSGFANIGDGFLKPETTYWSTESIIEIGIPYPINASLVGLEILVDSLQYIMDNDTDNYYAYINNNPVGSATCFLPYGTIYILQFDFSADVICENEEVIIEIYHATALSTKWYLVTENMFPAPFMRGFYHHSAQTMIDGYLNGNGSIIRYPPQYKVYYNAYSSSGENPNYENSITLTGFAGTHPVYDVPFSYTRKPIFFYYRVNQTVNPYTISVYREDIPVGYSQNYPRTLYNYDDTIGFTPLNDENYTVVMTNADDDELVNHSFYIINLNENYSIWTDPIPSLGKSDFIVNSYINDGESYDNYRIAFFEHDDNFNNINYAFDYVTLLNSTSYNAFVYSPVEVKTTYLRIFGDIGNNQWTPLASTYKHYMISIIGKQTYLDVSNNYVSVSETFSIHGYHPYITNNVRIRLGAISIYDCSNENTFKFDYEIQTKGTYTLTLEAFIDNSWVTLGYPEIVYVGEEGAVDGDSFQSIFDSVPLWIKGILGAIITLCFVFMPFIFLQYLEKINFKVDVPPVAYAISGCIGVTLCTVIGLFGFEIMFFICVVAGISLVISYVWKEKSD